VALTFNLFAAASSFADSILLVDCELEPDPEAFVVGCVEALDDCDAVCNFLPLKGGIGWMTMLIREPLGGAVAGVLVLTTEGLLTSFEDELVPDTLPELDVATLPEVAGTGELVAGVALSAAVAPMERACAEVASLEDFSMIARCFSSSLARIFTRSSGIGLFNWQRQYSVIQGSTELAGEIYLETLTELEQLSHTLIPLAFHQCLALLRQPLLLVSNKFTERRKCIRWRL
jgi:hypothetical protein